MKKVLGLFTLFTLFLHSNDLHINYLNDIREKLNLNPLKIDQRLSILSDYHLKYMMLENKVSHEEENEKNRFYYGYKIQNRIMNLYPINNYTKIGENISISYYSLKDSIDKLLEAPYHRLNFLRDFDSIGYSYTNTFKGKENLITYSLGKKNHTTNNNITIYPYSEQNEIIPFFFSDTESPDPINNKNIIGYPISLVNFKYFNPKFELINNSFNSKENILIKSSSNDRYLQNGEYLILPIKSLNYNTKYTLKIYCMDKKGNKKVFYSNFYTKKYNKVNYKIDYNNNVFISDGYPPYYVYINNKKVSLKNNHFKLKNRKQTFFISDQLN